jgi:hypothetical protein
MRDRLPRSWSRKSNRRWFSESLDDVDCLKTKTPWKNPSKAFRLDQTASVAVNVNGNPRDNPWRAHACYLPIDGRTEVRSME